MRRLPFMIYLISLTMVAAASSAVDVGTAVCASTRLVREVVTGHDQTILLQRTAIEQAAITRCLLLLIKKYNPRFKSTELMGLIESIYAASGQYDLDPLFVASVIAAESSFNPRARSRCGAEGLMQLTKPLQPWVGVSDPFDIEQNINGGCRYLKGLKSRFQRVDLVLAAYNAGPGRVARLGRVPNIQETVRYVQRVIWLHSRLTAEKTIYAHTVERVVMRDPFAPV